MFYVTGVALQGSEEAKSRAQEQRRVKQSVCRILLAHQLVNAGLLPSQDGAQLIAHKGGRVKLK